MPTKPERVEIEGLIYEDAGWNSSFGWATEKSAKESVPAWNKQLWGRWGKSNGRFSARKSEQAEKLYGNKCYGLVYWKFVDYTPEYTKTHPWVNYESFDAFLKANPKYKGKRY